jgi:hypothetical protein
MIRPEHKSSDTPDRAEEPRLQPAPPGATGTPRCGGANVMVIRGEV